MEYTVEFTCKEEYLPSPRHRKLQVRQTTYTHTFEMEEVSGLDIVAYWNHTVWGEPDQKRDVPVYWKDGQFYLPNYQYLDDWAWRDFSHFNTYTQFSWKNYFLDFGFEEYRTKERNLEDFDVWLQQHVIFGDEFLIKIPEPRVQITVSRSSEYIVLHNDAWSLYKSYYSLVEKPQAEFRVLVPEVFIYDGLTFWREGYRTMYKQNYTDTKNQIDKLLATLRELKQRQAINIQEIENSYYLENGKRSIETRDAR